MCKTITTSDGKVLEPITPSEDLQKLQEFSDKLISDTSYQQMLNSNININMFKNMPKFPSPEERLKFLTDKMDSMQSELESQTEAMRKIQCENMKLNAQTEIQNKTLDSNLKELNELRNVNAELKAMNKNLENSNRHYWRNTAIISFVIVLIFYLLGFITP
jgi:septal ring factor EnvC (AmiA/AmiB activator)